MRYIFLLVFLTGCLSPVSNFEIKTEGRVESVDDFIKKTFTDDAYKHLRDISVYESPSNTFGAALGTSNWSYVISVLFGLGFDRSVLIFNSNDVRTHLIHELVHHLDDIGRDGGKEFIDPIEFYRIYARSRKYTRYRYIVEYAEQRTVFHWLITSLFGIGEHSERIASCADVIWDRNDVPEDMKKLFRKIFRKWNEAYPD